MCEGVGDGIGWGWRLNALKTMHSGVVGWCRFCAFSLHGNVVGVICLDSMIKVCAGVGIVDSRRGD